VRAGRAAGRYLIVSVIRKTGQLGCDLEQPASGAPAGTPL